MKHLIIYASILFLMSAGFYACDSTTAPGDILKDGPEITHFHLSPKKIVFTQENDDFRDTTINVHVEARFKNQNNPFTPRVVFSDKSSNEIMGEAFLEIIDSRIETYAASIEIATTTTSVEEYIVNLLFDDKHGSYAQTTIKIKGFSNFPPEILEIDNPDEITRPSSGEIPAVFTAKVTDADGQETIDQVFIRVIDQQSGEVQGSPFEMFDDGSTYNDETANDSIYTWAQQITHTENNPNRDYDIEYYAIDQAGLSSDTVRTTFRIRE